MDTASIVLLSLIVAGIIVIFILVISYGLKDRIERKKQVKDKCSELDVLRRQITMYSMRYEEDQELNELESNCPEARETIRLYKELRDEYLGIKE